MTGLNVLTLVDALDRDATEGPRFADGRIMIFDRYVFHAAAVPPDGLLRITDDLLGPVIYTAPMVHRLHELTTGLSVKEVWRDEKE